MKRNIAISVCLTCILISILNGDVRALTNDNYSASPPNFAEIGTYNEMRAAMFRAEKASPQLTETYAADLARQILRQSVSNEAQVCAIYLAGQLKIGNAVTISALIDRIDLTPNPQEPRLRIIPWGQYPAEEALINIGAPTFSPILNRLLDEASELRRHLMCQVLESIKQRDAAVDQLKQRLVHEATEPRRTNLELSLKELEK